MASSESECKVKDSDNEIRVSDNEVFSPSDLPDKILTSSQSLRVEDEEDEEPKIQITFQQVS
jgi:hypothetical protein